MPFVAACLLYTLVNTFDFEQYGTLFLGYSCFCAIRVGVSPISPWRVLGLIIVDVTLVSLAMITDTSADSSILFFMVTACRETEKSNRAKEINITTLLKPSTFLKFSEAIIKIQKENPAAFS
ncbi:MAG: hypothetical protein R8M45_03320 [Ghiorsea sp.]